MNSVLSYQVFGFSEVVHLYLFFLLSYLAFYRNVKTLFGSFTGGIHGRK